MKRPPKRLLTMIFRYVTLLAAGAAIDALWKMCQLDHYDHWGRFYVVWFPAIYALFSTVYVMIATWAEAKLTGEQAAQTSRFWRYDDNTYLVLLWVLLVETVSPALDTAQLWLAATYVAVIFVKGGMFVAYAYQVVCAQLGTNQVEAQTDEASARPQRRIMPLELNVLLCLATLLVYVGISAYQIHRTSLTGDEPHYLLITHSLWHDHDTNLYNNYQNRDYAAFFWYDLQPAWGDQVSDTEIYSYRHKGGFPHVLIPGYVLGGQWGAVLEMNLITALLMLQVFVLAYELFGSFQGAFGAWLICAFTIPGIVFMNQLYPEIPAALLTILAVRFIRRLAEGQVGRGKAFWRHILLLGACIIALVILKTRYLPIAGALVLAWFAYLFRGRLRGKYLLGGLFGLAATGALGFGILMLIDRLFFKGDFWGRLEDTRFMVWIFSGHNPLHAALGLLVDQEYGLLMYASVYITALLGIGLLTRKEWRALWPLIGVLVVNYGVLAVWPLWHAAPTPPGRYLLPVLPVLSVFIARFWLSPRRTVQTLVVGVSGIWSAIMAWFLTIAPAFRYNWADGASHFLETASLHVGVNLVRLFPSWIRPSPLTPHVTGLGLLLFAVLLVFCRRKAVRPANAPQAPVWDLTPVLLVLIAFLGLAGAGIVVGKTLPTFVFEMEDDLDVRRQGGVREPRTPDPWVNQIYVREYVYSGWKLSPGDALRMRPTLRLKKYVLSVYARAVLKDTTKVPRLEVLLNGEVIGDTTVTSEWWHVYTFEMSAPEQRPLLEVVCAPELNEDHAIVVDKIYFQ